MLSNAARPRPLAVAALFLVHGVEECAIAAYGSAFVNAVGQFLRE